MSSKYTFFIVAICLSSSRIQAAELKSALSLFSYDNSCYFEHYGKILSEAEWLEGVNISSSILDIEPSFTKLYSASVRNVREISGIEVNGKYIHDKYIDILLVRNGRQNSIDLIIALATGFKNYEENETSIVMKINVTFLCENGYRKSLEIRQNIIDTNNHDPEFIPNNSEYYVPSKLAPYHFIGQVTARDIDLTNSNINFNFRSTGNNTENEYALLGNYQNEDDPKIFHAWLVTTQNVVLNHNHAISIFAQDSGKPSRTGNTNVRLLVEDNSSTPAE